MLVLGRSENESVRIGDGVIVKVIEARNGFVRLGFQAPREIAIVRTELERGADDSRGVDVYARLIDDVPPALGQPLILGSSGGATALSLDPHIRWGDFWGAALLPLALLLYLVAGLIVLLGR